jgi:hypothetical protein
MAKTAANGENYYFSPPETPLPWAEKVNSKNI